MHPSTHRKLLKCLKLFNDGKVYNSFATTKCYHCVSPALLSCKTLCNTVVQQIKMSDAAKINEIDNDIQEFESTSKVTPGRASSVKTFRCKKTNPAEHEADDIKLMYTIPFHQYRQMSPRSVRSNAFPKKFSQLCKAFTEPCVMIRKPGIELVTYLKATDPAAAVNRYLLYGKTGCGKTLCLQYAVHYCLSNGWLVLPSYNMWEWMTYHSPQKVKQKQEILASQYNKERVDQPERSQAWLKLFSTMNHNLLQKIKTSKKYVWSKHESSDEGITLGSLIDHGLARPRNSADVIGCIMREIRTQSSDTMPPTLVAVDCVNAVFGKTLLKLEPGVYLEPHELSFVYNLKKLLSNTWKNGAVVGALNSTGILYYSKRMKKMTKEHPYDLLSKEGFDWFDPHVPIHVPAFDDEEVLCLLAYFKDRKWLTGRSLSLDGEKEIIQICCNNPRDLVNYCGGLY